MGAGGLLVAGISLDWQVVSFLLSGIRVKVQTRFTLMVGLHGVDPGDERVVQVTVRNVGRLGVSVVSCNFHLADDTGLVPPRHPFSAQLPATLEPGHSLDH